MKHASRLDSIVAEDAVVGRNHAVSPCDIRVLLEDHDDSHDSTEESVD